MSFIRLKCPLNSKCILVCGAISLNVQWIRLNRRLTHKLINEIKQWTKVMLSYFHFWAQFMIQSARIILSWMTLVVVINECMNGLDIRSDWFVITSFSPILSDALTVFRPRLCHSWSYTYLRRLFLCIVVLYLLIHWQTENKVRPRLLHKLPGIVPYNSCCIIIIFFFVRFLYPLFLPQTYRHTH